MNINLFRNLLDDFSKLRKTHTDDEKTILKIQSGLSSLQNENDSIGYKKNDELINILIKNTDLAANAINRRRKYKEINFQLTNDVFDYIEQISKVEDEHFLFSEERVLNTDNIFNYLNNILVPFKKSINEATVENYINSVLCDIFGRENIHRQYSVGGFLGLKSDIDIGNGKVGIELKVAHSLSATEMQRLLGQVIYYKNRFYKDNLILLVVSRESKSSVINELMAFVQDLGVKTIFRRSMRI